MALSCDKLGLRIRSMGLGSQNTVSSPRQVLLAHSGHPHTHLGQTSVSQAPCKTGGPQGKGLDLHVASAKCHPLCRPASASPQPASPAFRQFWFSGLFPALLKEPSHKYEVEMMDKSQNRAFRTDNPFCPLRDSQEPGWHLGSPGGCFPQCLRRKMLGDMEE